MVIMADHKNMSIMELAYEILKKNEKSMTFVDLFSAIADEKDLSDDERESIIAQIYADFVSSGKFIYVGEDEWDIKGRQAIDLWDKDGAYYDEYPDYEEELSLYEDELEDEDEDESEYEKDYDESDVEDDEDEFIDDFDDELTEEEEELYNEFQEEEFDEEELDEEEEFEEFEEFEEEEEDFDDDEYNQYMDDYEEMYED
jgi:DNA-directed RNA polymerase subunit delta